MKKTLLALLTVTFCSTIFVGQDLDYKEIRKQLSTLSCGKVDSADVYKTRIRLETFDTTKITKDIDYYYRDLAWCYYRTWLKTKDTTYLRLDVNNYIKSFVQKPKDTEALWNCAFGFYKLGDCVNGKKYLDLCLKYSDPNTPKKQQIESLTKNCK